MQIRSGVARQTTSAPHTSMKLNHVTRSSSAMEAINVLGHQREPFKAILPPGNRLMRRVRFQGSQDATTIIEPFPNCRQITLEHSTGRDHIERHAFPNRGLAAATKRRHS